MIPIILVAEVKTATHFLDKYREEKRFSKDRIFQIFPLKKEIVISQIKEVVKRITLTSELPRLFIFFNFDTAASESQNALLKSLEEASLKNQFILVVENEYQVFPTIRSRSQIIRLKNQKTEADKLQLPDTLLITVENSTNYQFLQKNLIKNMDRDELIRILDHFLLHYKKRLVTDSQASKIIKKTLSTRALLLSNNLNPQLAYDNLLIFINKAFRMKI